VAKQAFDRALEALSHKERTTGELVAWLAEREVSQDEIADVIERLTEAGALDDERFAREYAADKRELRGWGPERIRGALADRGLDPRAIEAALAGDGRDEQLERAIALLERRGEGLVDPASRARALAYLARRGYESELAYEAVRGFERHAA
jgi:regulatory protein